MRGWVLLVVVGILSLVAGVVALAFPLPASLTVNAFVGAALVVAGAAGAWGALTSPAGSDRLWGALLGVATLALGAILLIWPLDGLTTLTVVAGLVFLASGLSKLLIGWRLATPGWRWMVGLAGVLSLVLGILILTGLPGSAAVVPGLLLAVELLAYGWGLIFIGLAWRRLG